MLINTNKVKIECSPYFAEKYKVLSFYNAGQDKNYVINKANLIKLSYSHLIESIYISKEKVVDCSEKQIVLSILIRNESMQIPIEMSYEFLDFKQIQLKSNNILPNLLINAIANSYPKTHNIEGNYLEYIRSNNFKKSIVFLEFNYYEEILKFRIRTATLYEHYINYASKEEREKVYTLPKHHFENGILSLKSDYSADKAYIFRSNSKSKNTMKLFSTSPGKKGFYDSKAYYVNRFINRFNQYYGDLASICLVESDYIHRDIKNGILKSFSNIPRIKLNVIDRSIQKNESVINKLVDLINTFKKRIPNIEYKVTKRKDSNTINLIIVDEPEEYLKNKLSDQYQVSNVAAVQHIFVNSILSTNAKHAVLNSIINGINKWEIVTKQLLLFNNDEHICDKYKFTARFELKSNEVRYITLSINGGRMSFFDTSDFICNYNFQHIGYVTNTITGEMYTVQNTDEVIIPNLKYLDQRFREYESFESILKEDFKIHLDEFSAQINPSDENVMTALSEVYANLNSIKTRLMNRDDILYCTKPLKDLSIRRLGYYGRFCSYLYSKTRTRFGIGLNNDDEKSKYLSGFVGIKYKTIHSYGKFITKYCVGTRCYADISDEIDKSNVIKTIDTSNQDFLDDYFRFIDVDFVNINQSTVVAFQFKYINEYADMLYHNKLVKH